VERTLKISAAVSFSGKRKAFWQVPQGVSFGGLNALN
jgi:hypothetical protein